MRARRSAAQRSASAGSRVSVRAGAAARCAPRSPRARARPISGEKFRRALNASFRVVDQPVWIIGRYAITIRYYIRGRRIPSTARTPGLINIGQRNLFIITDKPTAAVIIYRNASIAILTLEQYDTGRSSAESSRAACIVLNYRLIGALSGLSMRSLIAAASY